VGFRRRPERPVARTERWQREDESNRLSTEVRHLSTLKITIEEWRGDQHISGARYTKHVMVSSAPARFEVPCGEPRCQDGGHDITYEMMRALKDRQATIEGQSDCRGALGEMPCDRVVRFVALATYTPPTE
jgi:hypothetical protein